MTQDARANAAALPPILSIEFEQWAKQQTPPYYLKLNKWRLNGNNRWYSCVRTQYTYEGFVAAMSLKT